MCNVRLNDRSLPTTAAIPCPGRGHPREMGTSAASAPSNGTLALVDLGEVGIVAGVAIITEACIGVKDRACVDVCPVQCVSEFDPVGNVLVSEVEAGSGEIEGSHVPDPGLDRGLR